MKDERLTIKQYEKYIDIRITRYGMVTNESNLCQRPSGVEVNNIKILYGLQLGANIVSYNTVDHKSPNSSLITM